ncbi:hypothetical protein [uncultured Enterococcus sp.]|uniref:hypothetical protein n=1 Tax=uncultured Enterococcus sp. TaxID=167972 RepID=UPI002AA74211|nr:hypothetical protein [uncultured Enterococcus sp.]
MENNTVYSNLCETDKQYLELLLKNGWSYRKETLDTSEIDIELYFNETDASFRRQYPSYGYLNDSISEEATELSYLLGDFPEYYFHSLKELENERQKQEETIYRFIKEDLENALKDQSNYYPVKAIIEKGFSVVEDFQMFVASAEERLIEKEPIS